MGLEPDNFLSSLGRFSLLGVAALGIIASPFIYIAVRNNEKLENTIKELDKKQTHVFQNTSDCVAQGFTEEECQESFENAADFTESLGTKVSYSDNKECTDIHGNCEKRVTQVAHTTMVGKVPVTTYTHVTSYHPDMIAWQAARDDIANISVPLYETPDSTKAIRRDGKVFDLKP